MDPKARACSSCDEVDWPKVQQLQPTSCSTRSSRTQAVYSRLDGCFTGRCVSGVSFTSTALSIAPDVSPLRPLPFPLPPFPSPDSPAIDVSLTRSLSPRKIANETARRTEKKSAWCGKRGKDRKRVRGVVVRNARVLVANGNVHARFTSNRSLRLACVRFC